MHKHIFKIFSFFLCLLALCNNSLASISSNDSLKLVGKGDLNFMFWNVYEAELYTADGSYNKGNKLKLKLKYKMDIDSNDIVEASILEIKKQGFNKYEKLNLWKKEMSSIFPDVSDGDIIEGLYVNGKTIFYKDGNKIGEIDDQEFGLRFFDIWLGENTSKPHLRKKLLGQI